MNSLKRSHYQARPYATSDDFRRIFDEQSNDLLLFSLLLTGNRETAERCFAAGLEDCVHTNTVFKEWAHSWAKRTIILSSIRILQPRSANDAACLPHFDLPASDKLSVDWEGPADIQNASVVTSKPAMRGRLKTGHGEWPKTGFVLPCRSRFGKAD